MNTASNAYYSDGKMLIFKSLEDYEAVVDQPTKEVEMAFISEVSQMKHLTYLKTKGEQKTGVDLVGDDYLAQILSEDLTVQIGDWIYRVNKPEEKVFALSAENSDMYDDLVSENSANKLVLEFTTEDDIFPPNR